MVKQDILTMRMASYGLTQVYTETARIVSKSVGSDGRGCCVEARAVHVTYNDDCTLSHVVMTRADFLKVANSIHWTGRPYRQTIKQLLQRPHIAVPGILEPGESGHGGAYCKPAVRVKCGRRFVAFRQESGWDV